MPTSTQAVRTESERTFTTPQDFYRLRDFGQKFEATFAFLAKHGRNLYHVLLVPTLLALLPLMVTGALLKTSLGNGDDVLSSAGMSVASLISTGGFLLALLPIFTMLYSFVKCRIYHPDSTARITTSEVWAEAKGHMLPMFVYGFVWMVAVMLGMMLLAIPGLYLLMPLYLYPAVLVFEEEGGLSHNFRRSLRLIRGKWWSTFGLVMIGGLGVFLISAAITGIIGFIVLMMGEDVSKAGKDAVNLFQLVQQFVNLLLYPVLYLLLIFQYFNLVERHDAVGLQWRAAELGQNPAADSVAGSASDDNLFRPSYGGDQTL